eukprot:10988300-Alexandrium_andersonii.AAC.1
MPHNDTIAQLRGNRNGLRPTATHLAASPHRTCTRQRGNAMCHEDTGEAKRSCARRGATDDTERTPDK